MYLKSFHFNIDQWRSYYNKMDCPFCEEDGSEYEQENIPFIIEDVRDCVVMVKNFKTSLLQAIPYVCLKGTCFIITKIHYNKLFDMPNGALLQYMKEVQIAAKALKNITGAVKINYEIHGNTVPHMHVHLFPRYLNDPFAGKVIDVFRTDPSPYRAERNI